MGGGVVGSTGAAGCCISGDGELVRGSNRGAETDSEVQLPTYSAGLVLYRIAAGDLLELLIVHPGGPYWAGKDDGAWSIPKGEYLPGEDSLAAAEREFAEELGRTPPSGQRIPLGELRQPSGKRIVAWASSADFDVHDVHSNLFEIEWPPRSGRMQYFPEVDRALWCSLALARAKLLRGQLPFIDRLVAHLTEPSGVDGRARGGGKEP